MGRAVRAAIILSGAVVFFAAGCAGSLDIDLDESDDANDDPPPVPFWAFAALTAYFAAVPLALIWLGVLIAYLVKRARRPRAYD